MKSMYKPEFWQNLLLICEIISNGYFPVSLDFLSIFVVFCGIIVIISKNPAQEIWEISILFYPPHLRLGGGGNREKLSNSGNTLKLMIPSYIWNYINGWSNYSCMVTIDKIQETGIGNRGSKSIALFFFLLGKLSTKKGALLQERVLL